MEWRGNRRARWTCSGLLLGKLLEVLAKRQCEEISKWGKCSKEWRVFPSAGQCLVSPQSHGNHGNVSPVAFLSSLSMVDVLLFSLLWKIHRQNQLEKEGLWFWLVDTSHPFMTEKTRRPEQETEMASTVRKQREMDVSDSAHFGLFIQS